MDPEFMDVRKNICLRSECGTRAFIVKPNDDVVVYERFLGKYAAHHTITIPGFHAMALMLITVAGITVPWDTGDHKP